jgi:hypothetical protein
MLNFSNTLKSKTIIILQIFIIIFMGFYIKKNYFSNKIESFYLGNKIIFTKASNNIINLNYNNVFKTEKSYSYHCLLSLKLKECDKLKKEDVCNNETHCEYIKVDEKDKKKGTEDKCIKKSDVTESYLFDSETNKIENTSKDHIVILFEGENFDGNFMIIDNTEIDLTDDKYIINYNTIIERIEQFKFKSLKIINKEYLTKKTKLQYFQEIADKNNDILLFSGEKYPSLCYRIRLQPNEIEDFGTPEGEIELKRFTTFFNKNNITSIILPGNTKNQNDRTFRNIHFEIIDNNNTNIIIKNTKGINYEIGDISNYKVFARYPHLDTKTADKNLRQNELQLKKLKAKLNNKIDEMVEKQAENEEYEDKVMDSLLNRVFDKINNNFDRANYFKEN